MKANLYVGNTFVMLEGSRNEIEEILESFAETDASDKAFDDSKSWWDDKQYYSHSHHSFLNVTDMQDVHLVNAIVKKTVVGTGSVINPHRNVPFNRETLLDILKDEEARAMLAELCEREEIRAREDEDDY